MDIESNNKDILKICQKHKLPFHIIHIYDNSSNPFNCIRCIRDKGIENVKDLLHFSELIEQDDLLIFENFPPLEQSVQQKLRDIANMPNKNELIMKDIDKYFNGLKHQIDTFISKAQQQAKNKAIKFISSNEEIFKKYNTLSFKKELKQILQDGGVDMEKKVSTVLHNVTKKENQEKNSLILSECIQKHKIMRESINFDIPKKIEENILNFISKIDFFSEISEQQFEELCNNNNHKLLPNLQNERTNCEILIDLISSKTNFCEDEFLNRVNKLFNSFSEFINNQNLGKKICNEEARKSFQQLNQLQISNMVSLSNKIVQVSTSYSNQNVPEEEINRFIQPNTNKLLQLIGNIPQKESLKSILKQYPLIELISDFFGSSILNKVNLQKSLYKDSNLLSISRNSQGYLIISNTSDQLEFKSSYCDFILEQNKKYIFRVSFFQSQHKPKDTDLIFGLLADSTKNTTWIYQQNMAFCQYKSKGISNVIKGGNLISDNGQPVDREVEMRICLQDKILKVADFPTYQNVCELDDPNKIQLNTTYRFGMECYENCTMKITEILEVLEFDDKM